MASSTRVFQAWRALPLLLAAFLGGCSGANVTEAVRSLQGGTAEPEAPDFVLRSRAGAPSGYIPVGVTPPARSIPPRSAAEVRKLEKELADQREQVQAFARRPVPNSTYDGSRPSGRRKTVLPAGAQESGVQE